MKLISINSMLIAFLVLLFCSCAANYKSINPQGISYSMVQTVDSTVVLQYSYDVLKKSKNRKYAKKEAKFNVNLVAVKISNNSDSIITTNQLIYTSGGKFIEPLSPEITRKTLKQKSAYYLFYLLLSPTQLYTQQGSIPIGLGLGPVLVMINMGIASASNNQFELNLEKYTIENRIINPHQSIYALIGIRNIKGSPIYARIKRK